MTKLTEEQAVIIMAYTGISCCEFHPFHVAVEKKLGRHIFSHEFGSKEITREVKDAFRQDFLNILPE